MMRAVPSTHHQLLKYPTGIIGDQAMARTVAAVDRKKLGWAQRTSRVGSYEESPMDKKQKRIADQ